MDEMNKKKDVLGIQANTSTSLPHLLLITFDSNNKLRIGVGRDEAGHRNGKQMKELIGRDWLIDRGWTQPSAHERRNGFL